MRKAYLKPKTAKITFDYKVIASPSDETQGPWVPGGEDEEEVPLDDDELEFDLENW